MIRVENITDHLLETISGIVENSCYLFFTEGAGKIQIEFDYFQIETPCIVSLVDKTLFSIEENNGLTGYFISGINPDSSRISEKIETRELLSNLRNKILTSQGNSNTDSFEFVEELQKFNWKSQKPSPVKPLDYKIISKLERIIEEKHPEEGSEEYYSKTLSIPLEELNALAKSFW
jgi:hypothetical protein